MSATPRTVRQVVLPAAPRLHRVVLAHERPFGRISLFLTAAGLFGLTALCYLWQDSLAVEAALKIPVLNQELQDAQNRTAQLQSSLDHLQSFGVVTSAATTYGLKWPDGGQTVKDPQGISVLGPVRTHYVVVYTRDPRAASRTVPIRVSTGSAGVSGWWNAIWSAVYNVAH